MKSCTGEVWRSSGMMHENTVARQWYGRQKIVHLRAFFYGNVTLTLCLNTTWGNKKWEEEGDDLYLDQQLFHAWSFWSCIGQYWLRHF